MPGEWVNGKVFIEAFIPIKVDDLKIHVKGKEKAKFRTSHYEGEGENRRRVWNKHKHEKTFLELKDKLADFDDGTLVPGVYECGFAFCIP